MVFFVFDGCGRPMAGIDHRFAGKGKQYACNAVFEAVVITCR